MAAITKLEYAAETSDDFEPAYFTSKNLLDAIKRDPIAILRSLIHSVSTFLEHYINLSLKKAKKVKNLAFLVGNTI